MDRWGRLEYEETGKLLLRIAAAGFVLVYGVQKIIHPEQIVFIMNTFTNVGLPGFLAYAVYIGEVAAPFMMIIGWRTRFAASIVALTMLVVIFLGHSGEISPLSAFSWWGIELQTLFLVNAVAVMLLGAGRYALSNSHRWD